MYNITELIASAVNDWHLINTDVISTPNIKLGRNHKCGCVPTNNNLIEEDILLPNDQYNTFIGPSIPY
jgi:hypothetical protein